MAAVVREAAHAGLARDTRRRHTPRDAPVILREVIGLGALTLSAVVPLWTARAILGAIVALLPRHPKER